MRTTQGRAERRWLTVGLALAVVACSPTPPAASGTAAPAAASPTGDVLVEAAALIAEQKTASGRWSGPPTGVRRFKTSVEIDYVAADGSNGGVMAVYDGIVEAAAAMGWPKPMLRDGGGTPDGRAGALRAAITASPAAIILGGFDPSEQTEVIGTAKNQKIVILGWHAGPVAGPVEGSPLFTNVSTSPSEVATLAADYVIDKSGGHAGVAIFTDSQYQIALDKANIMKAQIDRCGGCKVLAFRDLPIADSAAGMPAAVSDLRHQFGSQLTFLLAINGNYFAGSRQELTQEGVGPMDPPFAVAAGDGDQNEFDRIRKREYQLASVAEPLYLQGWQLVDEVNRALAGTDPSGFVAGPGLIKFDTVPDPGKVWDPGSDYRSHYKQLWGVGS